MTKTEQLDVSAYLIKSAMMGGIGRLFLQAGKKILANPNMRQFAQNTTRRANAFRQGAGNFTNAFSNLASGAKAFRQGAGNFTSAASNLGGAGVDAANATANAARTAFNSTHGFIRENPLKSVLGAATIGAGSGRLYPGQFPHLPSFTQDPPPLPQKGLPFIQPGYFPQNQ